MAGKRHVREGMSALDVHDGGPDEILIDCSCGWAGIMPSGGDEYGNAEAVHAAHVERVRNGAAEDVPTPAAQACIEEFYS
jgi:hypothetical protein